jgi:hypothetical protein
MKYAITITAALLLTVATYSQGLYSLTYTVSFATGDAGKYIGSASFRGFTFDGRGFVSDQVSIGGLFNWATFYEKLAGESFTSGTATLTGTQYRYINAFPMLLTGNYYLGTDEFEPRVYLGAGAGAYDIIQRTNAGVWSIEDNYWHFGISPEVGLLYPMGLDSYFNISLRYHYAFKAKETIDYSWFGLSVGFAWGE